MPDAKHVDPWNERRDVDEWATSFGARVCSAVKRNGGGNKQVRRKENRGGSYETFNERGSRTMRKNFGKRTEGVGRA